MYQDDCNLPDLEPCRDFLKYDEYVSKLYAIFCNDFINHTVSFNGSAVDIDHTKGTSGREKGFEHVITNDYEKENKRYPDFQRCERIRWIRYFIESNDCHDKFQCDDALCEGIKVWEKWKGKRSRIKFLLVEESFIVIIERKKNWFILVTAYYIDQDHTMAKLEQEYNESISAKTE